MAVLLCHRGHYYDSDKYESCPHCALAASAEDSVTVALGHAQEQQRSSIAKERLVAFARKDAPAADKTISVFTVASKQNPVVGWLVCVEGAEKGMDFRLHAGRNFVGRSPGMDICLPGDDQVHRDNHCSVIYEPSKSAFALAPGEGAYPLLNGEQLTDASALKHNDRIIIGSLEFRFISFCGEDFAW